MIKAMKGTTFEWSKIKLPDKKSVIAYGTRQRAMKEKLTNKAINKR